MKNEDVSKLIEEFVRRVKLYEAKYGRDEFWKACLNVYTDELKDWHDSQHGATEINKQRLTIIANVLLDAISYTSKKNIKEQFMKKSQLKALIREVIEEVSSHEISIEKLGTAGFKLVNIGGNLMCKKENLLVYNTNNPYDKQKQDWRATTHIVRGNELPTIPYEKGVVETMDDVMRWEKIINSKKP